MARGRNDTKKQWGIGSVIMRVRVEMHYYLWKER